MIDIVCFEDKELNKFGKKLGFSIFYNINDLNIKFVKNEDEIRKGVEKKSKVDIIVGVELISKKDSFHQRNSGLNQVICKLAKENNVAIGFSFSTVLNSKKRALILGRMMQNVKLCRKYKVKIVCGSFAKNRKEMRDAKDLLSFCRVIGMDPGEAKKALNYK